MILRQIKAFFPFWESLQNSYMSVVCEWMFVEANTIKESVMNRVVVDFKPYERCERFTDSQSELMQIGAHCLHSQLLGKMCEALGFMFQHITTHIKLGAAAGVGTRKFNVAVNV